MVGAMSVAEMDDWQHTMMQYGYRTRDVPSPALPDDLTGDLADLKVAITRHRSATALPRLAGVARLRGTVHGLNAGEDEIDAGEELLAVVVFAQLRPGFVHGW